LEVVGGSEAERWGELQSVGTLKVFGEAFYKKLRKKVAKEKSRKRCEREEETKQQYKQKTNNS